MSADDEALSTQADRLERAGWRLRAKFAGTLVLALVTAGIGFWLLPSAPLTQNIVQPTITIAASQPDLTIAVSMTASGDTTSSAPPARQHFWLALKLISPISGPVTFVVRMQSVRYVDVASTPHLTQLTPAGVAAPAASATQPWRQHDYLAMFSFFPSASAAAAAASPPESLRIATLRPIVSAVAGADLQISFPLITTELPGPAGVSSALSEYSSGQLLGGYVNPPAVPGHLYPPRLQMGITKFDAAGAGADLADFQTLAGDPPTATPNQRWTWTGLDSVSMLAQNVIAADSAQQGLFWSGTLLGVAAASGVACALELLALWTRRSARRRARLILAAVPVADPQPVADD